jgi:hypothetical protein
LKAALILLALFYSSSLFGEVLCKKGSLNRIISVVYNRPGLSLPCEVVYEKSESKEMHTLWKAKNQAGYCEQKAKQFVKEFEAKGWDCKPLSSKTT